MKQILCCMTFLVLLISGCGDDTQAMQYDDNNTTNEEIDDNRTIPSDPYLIYAWHLGNTAKPFSQAYSIDPESGIHLDNSWKKTRGEGVIIAVLDDYFEPDHPDLRDNVLATFNASDGSANVTPPDGVRAHGQYCAGVLGAAANTIGSAGVAPEAKLLLISHAYESDANIIRAFEYARSAGADIISCSWGSYAVSDAVAAEIQSIYASGITIVFAAGNNDLSLDSETIHDESELPWVIGVGASNEANQRAFYSNYGEALDLLSPGGERIGIVTTDLSDAAGRNVSGYYGAEIMLDANATTFYGTSAAAPLVAGAAALLKSVYPQLTPDAIRQILTESAEKIADASYDANGFNPRYGYGKLNVDSAFEHTK